jgi:hypothetical protein
MVVGGGGGGGVGRATIDACEVGKIFKSGGLSRAKREERILLNGGLEESRVDFYNLI